MNKDNKIIPSNEECSKLPLIDLNQLNQGNLQRENCKKEMVKAAMEWGFFQVVNHGVPSKVLESMRCEIVNMFREPFEKKSLNSEYRWGTPTATRLSDFSWSEAFHIPLDIVVLEGPLDTPRSTIKELVKILFELAQKIAKILGESSSCESNFFNESCLPSNSFIRMNRYPQCLIDDNVYGLVKHTDTNFLTILYQDQSVEGLQVAKDGIWVTVKPIPEALIINVGDLFQSWSNGAYKSAEHRVMANRHTERFSMAYFFCPTDNTVIESCKQPSVYRKFSFGEYKFQIMTDVKALGQKIGLDRFLL
ncbi:hypothetical protein IFM89_013101 [Coptis chinensis]|uniref:Fe2OG dioxygenase domain-containing protein n=1 Tax=Coptis chinensis TaxID=261450 RepID=A0A835MB37_9MAGN|nr:hypothetical protein IFM89_013101 [Coptis chinensis]